MSSDSGSAPRRELSKEEQLDRALASPITELPDNEPKGWLGEKNPDFRKVDDFTPDLNAGLLQENDMGVVWLAIVLGYLIFFIPGFVILWMSKRVPQRTKIVATVVMVAGMVAFAVFILGR
jgi:hypothetical protein